MSFLILNKTKNSHARIGQLSTNRGLINTPAFMPIGTYGPVKTLSPKDLNDVGSQIILGNTYHLYLRPGIELIKKIKGLHNLIGWKKPILTDSGGFQVFSLAKLNKITNDGVFFTSNIDGKKHFLTPQLSMKIQKILGSDIIMSFDQCPAANIENIDMQKKLSAAERESKRLADAEAAAPEGPLGLLLESWGAPGPLLEASWSRLVGVLGRLGV